MAADYLAIAHDIPGRLRVRLPPAARAEGLESVVKQLSGVATCRWSPQTRSLLITYHVGEVGPAAILEAIASHTRVGAPPDARPGLAPAPPSASTLSTAMVETVADVDRRLQRFTGGVLALRVLFPLALALWAVRDLARGTGQALPWSSALWYAHGLFRDYNLPGGD